MKRITEVWGWNEQNEAAFGPPSKLLVPDGVFLTREDFNDDKELTHSPYWASEGRWFFSFLVARRAALEFWEHQKKTSVAAIRKIRAARLVDGEVVLS